MTFTVYRSLLTTHYPFTVIRELKWLMANGKYMVNGATGRSVL